MKQNRMNKDYNKFKLVLTESFRILIAILIELFDDKPLRNKIRRSSHHYLGTLLKICETRGLKAGIKYAKDTRSCVMTWLFDPRPSKYALASFKVRKRNGIPLCLGKPLRDLMQSRNIPVIRYVMTLVNITKSLRFGRVPDYTPITSSQGHINHYFTHYADKYLDDFISELNIKSFDYEWKEFHFTSKSGPNGHALWTSMLDYQLIRDIPSLFESIKTLGGSKLSEVMDKLSFPGFAEEFNKFVAMKPSNSNNLKFRRLVNFSDKEDKVRIIAILDYFSQTALKSLNDSLFKILRTIPQDCTHEQGKPFSGKYNLGICDKGHHFTSIDLTSATDRFPISVIKKVLSKLVPHNVADAWENIMVGHPFLVPNRKGSSFVRYGRGNPMGAYSSWASFALAHHFIMYIACRMSNIPFKKAKYAILGDDIIIGNDLLDMNYRILLRSIDVPFNQSKTHKSFIGYEFAKRLFYNGDEVSPLPLNGLFHNRNSFIRMGLILFDRYDKGFDPEKIRFIIDGYMAFRGIPLERRAVILNKVKCAIQLRRAMLGMDSMLESWKYMKSCLIPFCYEDPNFDQLVTEKVARETFDMACIELFTKDLNRIVEGFTVLDDYKYDIYDKMFKDKKNIFNRFKIGTEAFDLFPLFRVIKSQLKANTDAADSWVDTVGSDDEWTLGLRSKMVSVEPKMFSSKSYDVIVRAVSKVIPLWLEYYELYNKDTTLLSRHGVDPNSGVGTKELSFAFLEMENLLRWGGDEAKAAVKSGQMSLTAEEKAKAKGDLFDMLEKEYGFDYPAKKEDFIKKQ